MTGCLCRGRLAEPASLKQRRSHEDEADIVQYLHETDPEIEICVFGLHDDDKALVGGTPYQRPFASRVGCANITECRPGVLCSRPGSRKRALSACPAHHEIPSAGQSSMLRLLAGAA